MQSAGKSFFVVLCDSQYTTVLVVFASVFVLPWPDEGKADNYKIEEIWLRYIGSGGFDGKYLGVIGSGQR